MFSSLNKKIMKKNIAPLMFAFLLVSSCLHSMEKDLLIKKKPPQEEVKEYLNETLSKLELLEIRKCYHKILNDCRGRLIRRMPSELHGVELCLLPEIREQIRKKVLNVMFEDDVEVMNILYYEKPPVPFYKMSQEDRDRNLRLCDEVERIIRGGESVARLYEMPEQECNDVSRYYPIMKEDIKEFDDDTQAISCRRCGRFAAQGCLVWPITYGMTFSLLSVFNGFEFACTLTALKVIAGFSSDVTPVILMIAFCYEIAKMCHRSKRVTL